MLSQKHTKHGPSILLGSAWSVEVWVQQCWWEFVWGIDRKEDEIFFAAYPPYTYSQSLIVQLDMVLLPRARHWTWMYFMNENRAQHSSGGMGMVWMVCEWSEFSTVPSSSVGSSQSVSLGQSEPLFVLFVLRHDVQFLVFPRAERFCQVVPGRFLAAAYCLCSMDCLQCLLCQ